MGDVENVVRPLRPKVDVVFGDQLHRLDEGVPVLDLGDVFPELVVPLEGAVSREHISDHDLAVEVLADEVGNDAVGDT